MITNYSTLKSSIADWLLRDDLTPVIPSFIALAEARMNRDSRLRTKDAIVRGTLSVSAQFTTLPAAFRRMINLEYQTTPVRPLEYRTPQQMDLIRASNPSGTPYYYCVHGTELEVVPVPSETVTLGAIYYAGITALSDSNTSNWLLTAAPDIYLYASLLQAAPYLKEDERVPVWASLYDQLCNEYQQSSEADQSAGAPLVVTSGAIG